jgi:phosphoglycerate dehydrogenase-like enzyme
VANLLLALQPWEHEDFLPPTLRKRLESLPFDITTISPSALDSNAWEKILHDIKPEVLVSCWSTHQLPIDTPVSNEPSSLKYVCHLAGSVKKLVPRPLIERGLSVSNWGSAVSRTIAECALLLTLSALRRTSHWAIAMHRDGKWKDKSEVVTESLFGRSVGIHGFGRIAQQLVPLLRPFGVSISAYEPGMPDKTFIQQDVARCNSLEELFSHHDIVIELAAYTSENHHVISEALLSRIRPGGIFVNVGRGAVVDELALIRVAQQGVLQVALDVYEVEPLPQDSPLRGLPNVTLLPHIAGPTKDRRRDAGELALLNLERYVNKQPLDAEVTVEVYDRTS